MSEPDIPEIALASREDLEKMRDAIIARIQIMDDSVNAMRSQNSAEHGALDSRMSYSNELLTWLKAQWIRFSK